MNLNNVVLPGCSYTPTPWVRKFVVILVVTDPQWRPTAQWGHIAKNILTPEAKIFSEVIFAKNKSWPFELGRKSFKWIPSKKMNYVAKKQNNPAMFQVQRYFETTSNFVDKSVLGHNARNNLKGKPT